MAKFNHEKLNRKTFDKSRNPLEGQLTKGQIWWRSLTSEQQEFHKKRWAERKKQQKVFEPTSKITPW